MSVTSLTLQNLRSVRVREGIQNLVDDQSTRHDDCTHCNEEEERYEEESCCRSSSSSSRSGSPPCIINGMDLIFESERKRHQQQRLSHSNSNDSENDAREDRRDDYDFEDKQGKERGVKSNEEEVRALQRILQSTEKALNLNLELECANVSPILAEPPPIPNNTNTSTFTKVESIEEIKIATATDHQVQFTLFFSFC